MGANEWVMSMAHEENGLNVVGYYGLKHLHNLSPPFNSSQILPFFCSNQQQSRSQLSNNKTLRHSLAYVHHSNSLLHLFLPLGLPYIMVMSQTVYSMTSAEYESVLRDLRKEVNVAFWSYCRCNGEEQKKGIKRVNFLMVQNQFLGLSRTRKGNGVWELNVLRWAGEA